MIGPCRCFERNCVHLTGIDQPNHPEAKRLEDEEGQVWVCPAFPRGIPEDIAYGDNLHGSVDPRQEDGTEDIVYQQAEA